MLAEGVETEDELQFLQEEHCDEMQGYLLGRPALIETFRDLTDGDAVADLNDTRSVPLAQSA